MNPWMRSATIRPARPFRCTRITWPGAQLGDPVEGLPFACRAARSEARHDFVLEDRHGALWLRPKREPRPHDTDFAKYKTHRTEVHMPRCPISLHGTLPHSHSMVPGGL